MELLLLERPSVMVLEALGKILTELVRVVSSDNEGVRLLESDCVSVVEPLRLAESWLEGEPVFSKVIVPGVRLRLFSSVKLPLALPVLVGEGDTEVERVLRCRVKDRSMDAERDSSLVKVIVPVIVSAERERPSVVDAVIVGSLESESDTVSWSVAEAVHPS